MTELPIVAPARYFPVTAIAFGMPGGDGVTVDADHPLPMELAPAPSGVVPLAGSVSSSTVLGPFTPRLGRPIWLSLSGNWTGSAAFKRSPDGGATRLPLTAGGAPWGIFNGNACEQVVEETEAGATYFLDVSLLSGTLTYRVSQ
ncbi:hypothetical protein [Altererythrobacter fulvus]|uniref:hypothetical protein n=1 Tax=Caenibius fulvus TaxID=2126012 RepID=UPI003015DC8E